MFKNIKYMGRYQDEEQLKTGRLPEAAIKYEEPDTMKEVFIKGTLISVPIFIIMIIGILVKIQVWQMQFSEINIKQLAGGILIASIISLPLVPIHEGLHAICYPKESIKEIWYKKEEPAAFVYCNAPISRRRFIWMSLCPNLVLGFIPYVLWIMGMFDGNRSVSQILISLAVLNIFTGIGDYLNIYSTITQTPKDSIIQNYGFHSYWYREENK
ncbi:DUF3267 domain-containing protein [Cellulosilyticum sp. ST5]|uniref:DUF3267 domain-containing protein n=1 Tax=unclassified Cellulosilyticum TaxID=2643091 RepID=UPI000F8EDF6E|nr:DUF3267 domain-containing protein [Cellulosilyticum sp. WCF-2]QEH68002.1 DUF3267 domain-containing protein [Cellulosilyticum sp. WCF-2]